jgi:hypothetical protein
VHFAAFAQSEDISREEVINSQIIKIQKEIDRLENKLKVISAPQRRAKIKDLIDGHRARMKKLEAELEEIYDSFLQEVSSPEEVSATPEVLPYVPEVVKEEGASFEEPVEEERKRLKFEIGATLGLFAGATGAFGEVRIPLNYVVGPATSTLRFAGGLVENEGMGRRYAPVHVDGVLNFPPGWFTGVENYLGAGLNYVFLTSGGKQGTIGGEVFYGIEGTGFGGKLFGEMGWGVLRTGFSPSCKGTTVMVGYRRDREL